MSEEAVKALWEQFDEVNQTKRATDPNFDVEILRQEMFDLLFQSAYQRAVHLTIREHPRGQQVLAQRWWSIARILEDAGITHPPSRSETLALGNATMGLEDLTRLHRYLESEVPTWDLLKSILSDFEQVMKRTGPGRRVPPSRHTRSLPGTDFLSSGVTAPMTEPPSQPGQPDAAHHDVEQLLQRCAERLHGDVFGEPRQQDATAVEWTLGVQSCVPSQPNAWGFVRPHGVWLYVAVDESWLSLARRGMALLDDRLIMKADEVVHGRPVGAVRAVRALPVRCTEDATDWEIATADAYVDWRDDHPTVKWLHEDPQEAADVHTTRMDLAARSGKL